MPSTAAKTRRPRKSSRKLRRLPLLAILATGGVAIYTLGASLTLLILLALAAIAREVYRFRRHGIVHTRKLRLWPLPRWIAGNRPPSQGWVTIGWSIKLGPWTSTDET